MEIESIRNPKVALLSNAKGLGLAAAVALCAAGAGYCASGNKGKVVSIATHPGEVRGCAFLGRVTGPASDDNTFAAGSLSQRVAEMGGNVLLLLQGGTGEAWSCEQPVRTSAEPANPTPKRPVTGLAPTAAATPRT